MMNDEQRICDLRKLTILTRTYNRSRNAQLRTVRSMWYEGLIPESLIEWVESVYNVELTVKDPE